MKVEHGHEYTIHSFGMAWELEKDGETVEVSFESDQEEKDFRIIHGILCIDTVVFIRGMGHSVKIERAGL